MPGRDPSIDGHEQFRHPAPAFRAEPSSHAGLTRSSGVSCRSPKTAARPLPRPELGEILSPQR